MSRSVNNRPSASTGTSATARRRRWGWARAGGLLALLTVAGGWSLVAQSCCERQACEDIRFLNGQIAGGYAACCQRPADQQQACFTELDSKMSATQTLILTAKIACDNGDDALIRDTIKQIRDLWLPKIIKSAAGVVQNQMIALGHRDWIAIDATLPRDPGCKAVTVSMVGGKAVNPEATGKASEEARSATPGAGGAEAVAVLPANAAQSYTACTYTVPANTTFNLRFGDVWNGLNLSGSISVAQTAAFPAAGSADVGLPTGVSLTASTLGQKLTLELDKTSPYNTLRLDADGNGTLGVALTLSSDSRALIGLVQVGSTIYFQLPVQVSADWSTMRIRADATTPGDTITPTVPVILAGSDTPPRSITPLPTSETRCNDANGNGIRDGADEVISAISSQLNCGGATAQH